MRFQRRLRYVTKCVLRMTRLFLEAPDVYLVRTCETVHVKNKTKEGWGRRECDFSQMILLLSERNERSMCEK